MVVAYPSKNTNWKRITTIALFDNKTVMLLLILLKIQIESESQLSKRSKKMFWVVAYPSKNTNWKRITTQPRNFVSGYTLLLILLKIQIESESQPIPLSMLIDNVVAYPSKNTNWKRITTVVWSAHGWYWLLLILLKIQIESESQRISGVKWRKPSCCLSF